ncbi:MAG: hypothetical protein AAF757_02415 [Cyanobacteria bacterium P01_D01_bin.116]
MKATFVSVTVCGDTSTGFGIEVKEEIDVVYETLQKEEIGVTILEIDPPGGGGSREIELEEVDKENESMETVIYELEVNLSENEREKFNELISGWGYSPG